MRKICFLHVLLFLFSGLAVSKAQSSPSQWNQWRGPNRDGHVDAQDWPERVSGDSFSLQWSHPLKASYSSPVLDDTLVYTTETVDDQTERALAYDRLSGELVWSTSWSGGMKVPFFARANGSWIRSTPLLVKNRLYVMGMQETLVCLDAGSGNLLWKLSAPKALQTPDPSFGGVSSPLIEGDALYVQAGGGVIKVDIDKGELLWSSGVSSDSMNSSPFSSPMLFDIHGQTQLVILERTRLCGVDLESGKHLWSKEVPAFRGMNILTPTQVGNRLLTATYGGKTHLFEPSVSESGAWQVKEQWQYKFQGYMSSPVVAGGHVYLHGRSGRMVCLDLDSGALKWTSEKSFGKYCSQVTNGKKMLCLSNDGMMRLVEINPSKCVILDKRRVSDEETWAHLGMVGRDVFIRSLNALSFHRWESSETQRADRGKSIQNGSTAESLDS